MTTQYDPLIQQSAEYYLPGVDWRLIKAQLWKESNFNPHAVSQVGAQGIAQFMPDTWRDVIKHMEFPDGVKPDPFNPEHAIPACCRYMADLYGKWTAPRPPADRYALTLASYNAGFGNLLKAQKLAGGANGYADIIRMLPRVTGGQHALETVEYVVRIFTHYVQHVCLPL